MDGERNEEGRYCLVARDAAAGSYAGRQLNTAKRPRSGEAKRRDRWRAGTFIWLSEPWLRGAVGR